MRGGWKAARTEVDELKAQVHKFRIHVLKNQELNNFCGVRFADNRATLQLDEK
jgi:hypothetical protein